MSLPRVSAISFLNTAPLMWDFEHGDLGRHYEISYTIPSLCAEALARGDADIGLIPTVAYATIPDLLVVPDVAIAARGEVRSILLVSERPLEEVRTVAADTASRTSVALCRVLCRRWFPPRADSREREFIPSDPDLPAMLSKCDAALLIGDSALRVDRSRYRVFDLGDEWHQMTSQPFVFAFWTVRAAAARPEMVRHFAASRDHGLQPASLDQIARDWAPRVGISEDDVKEYLTRNIHYRLDDQCLASLELFLEIAAEEGILAPAPRLRFLGQASGEAVA